MARSSADNAAMESFFALLQKDVLEQQRWATRAELRLAIVTWIEKTYHRTRRQRRLGRLTPIEFEKLTGPHTRSEPLNPTSQQKWGQSGSTFEEALALPPRKPSRAGVALMSSSWASVRAASSPAVS